MAKKVEELECYRLAVQLRTEVHAICALPDVKRQLRFCAGFSEAAGSVCRNISEGFARFSSSFIVQFFRYALGSIDEVTDYLRGCRNRNFIDTPRFERLMDLAGHTRATTLKFFRHHQAKVEAAKDCARDPTAGRRRAPPST